MDKSCDIRVADFADYETAIVNGIYLCGDPYALRKRQGVFYRTQHSGEKCHSSSTFKIN